MSARTFAVLTMVVSFAFAVDGSSDTSKTIAGSWMGTVTSDQGEIQKVEYTFSLQNGDKVEGDGLVTIVRSRYSRTGLLVAVQASGGLQDGKYQLSVVSTTNPTGRATTMLLTLSDDGDALVGNGESAAIGNFSVEMKRK